MTVLVARLDNHTHLYTATKTVALELLRLMVTKGSSQNITNCNSQTSCDSVTIDSIVKHDTLGDTPGGSAGIT